MGYNTFHDMLDQEQAEQEALGSADEDAQARAFLPKRVRHLKSGGAYKVLGTGRMQSEKWVFPHHYTDMGERETDMMPVDMQEVVIYRAEADGTFWVRPYAEFMDGRFEPLATQYPGPCPTPDEISVLFVDDRWCLPISNKLASAITRPEVDLTEDDGHILEAAEQIAGIETIDDDARTYVVTREQIVKLMTTVRDTTREHARQVITTKELGLPEKGADLNRWIDEQVYKERTTSGLIDVRRVAEIARGAALQVIVDRARLIDNMANMIFQRNVEAGWWENLETGESIRETRNVGELLMLMVSEIAEAMEGDRKNLPSDKLPGFSSVEEEIADLFIRGFDFAGAKRLRLGAAIEAKLAYNANREDHKRENRMKPDGKRY